MSLTFLGESEGISLPTLAYPLLTALFRALGAPSSNMSYKRREADMASSGVSPRLRVLMDSADSTAAHSFVDLVS